MPPSQNKRKKTDDRSLSVKTKLSKKDSRRTIRSQYSALIKKTDNVDEKNASDTLNIANQAEILYKNVDHPREAKLDSKLLSRISEIGKKQTNYINPSVIKFSEKEFCQLLKNESVQNGGLKTIYEKISGIIRQTSKCSLLTSDFQLTLPTRKRPQTNFQSDSNLEAKIPKLMQNIENNDEISSKAVVDLYTSLARACQDETQPIENQFKAIPFYKFIINPNSFSQTIQNIFHLSFLVKNGNVVFQQVDDEYFITPNINRAESSQSLSNNQEIISFSMHIWREKIKKYNLLKTS